MDHEDPQFVHDQSEVWLAWVLQLASEVGAGLWDWTFNLCGLHLLWLISVRIELNW